MYKKVFAKYLSVISLVVVLGFLSMTMLQLFLTADALADQKKELLLENAQNLSRQTALSATATHVQDNRVMYHLNERELAPLLNIVSGSIDATVAVTNGEGKVLMSAGPMQEVFLGANHALESVVPRVGDGYYEVGTLGGLHKSGHYTAAVPVKIHEDVVLGYVFITAPADSMLQVFKNNLRVYGMSVLGALLLCFGMVWLMTDRFVRPLKQMAAATRRFAQGDFSARVKVKGRDEVAELADALNHMAVSLSSVETMRRSFIANVSHELKTPMTTIAGFMDGMLDGTIPQEKQPHYMKIVSDEVKRLSRLVRSMLDLSRIDSGELKMNRVRFDLSEVLFSVLVASEQRIEQKELSITGLDACQRLEVEGDYDLLNPVLYNLVDNAIKFTDRGGTIDLRLSRRDQRAYVSIRNTGAGIPASEMPRIFERFYKSDRSRSLDKNGVGLGLYIVHTVIRLHQGEVSVRSVEGEFTEFSFWIPLSD